MATFKYPGVNLALRYENIDVFNSQHPIYPIGVPENSGGDSDVLPMREVAMMMLMDKLTDKPDWHKKIFDEAIVQKWRDEARKQPEDGLFARIMEGKERDKIPKPTSRIISEKAFECCIAELRNKAQYYSKSGLIPTFDSAGNSIVKSDSFIDHNLHERLRKAFDTLRAHQADNIDWHPKSNDMVQDLVHPSMFPFVYGRSKFIQEEVVGVSNALDFVGQGATVAKDTNPATTRELVGQDRFRYGVGSGRVMPELWSNTYQWLPSNVKFREDGSAQLTSYVNNLHPKKFPEIYETIEKCIDKAIPAWDQCLRESLDYRNNDIAGRTSSRFSKITEASDSNDALWSPKFDVSTFKDADIPLTRKELVDLNSHSWPENRVEPDWDDEEQRKAQGLPPLTPNIDDETLAREKWYKVREAILPEPYESGDLNYEPKKSLAGKFKEHGLQVIVKMASIELTPDKPEFPTGGWHIEGQMNEKICATALYYLDSHNVTQSHLSFQMLTSTYFSDDIRVQQDEYNYLERVYGTPLGPCGGCTAECLQTYGDVDTREGRILAFPNTFHHRVSSFRLQDPTKPGYRRFIALWLVDPHRRIISTANVPPQQMDWWKDEIDSGNRDTASPDGAQESLMSVDEAREHRLSLMDERTSKRVDEAPSTHEYNFCEH